MTTIEKAIVCVWEEMKRAKIDFNKVKPLAFAKAVTALMKYPESEWK
jgi:hypothetical protein